MSWKTLLAYFKQHSSITTWQTPGLSTTPYLFEFYHLEEWHCHVNKLVKRTWPNKFAFMNVLERLVEADRNEIWGILMEHFPASKNPIYTELNKQISPGWRSFQLMIPRQPPLCGNGQMYCKWTKHLEFMKAKLVWTIFTILNLELKTLILLLAAS